MTRHHCFDTDGKSIPAPPDVVNPKERHGVPIGNLTSQLFANIYLNELDHFVKERLRIKWYGRYMDDFLVISSDKEYLKQIRAKIKTFLIETLHLRLHPRKNIIQNVNEGIPFVGYRIFYGHILVRGKTLLRMRKKLKLRRVRSKKDGKIGNLEATYSSIRGHLKHANAFGLEKNLFEERIVPEKPKAVRKAIVEQLKLFSLLISFPIPLVFCYAFYYY